MPAAPLVLAADKIQRLSRRVERIAAQIANHVHADALVEDLLQFFGQRDVLDDELVQFEAERAKAGFICSTILSASAA
jgi:hypothetical protein